jgi:hypothetical protein
MTVTASAGAGWQDSSSATPRRRAVGGESGTPAIVRRHAAATGRRQTTHR